jgi:hypothetical protein
MLEAVKASMPIGDARSRSRPREKRGDTRQQKDRRQDLTGPLGQACDVPG